MPIPHPFPYQGSKRRIAIPGVTAELSENREDRWRIGLMPYLNSAVFYARLEGDWFDLVELPSEEHGGSDAERRAGRRTSTDR